MVCLVRVSHWIAPLKFHSRLCSPLLLMERASWGVLSELLVAVSVEVCCAKSVLSHRSNTKSLSQRIVSGEKNLKFSFRKVQSRAFNPPYVKIEMWGFVTLLCVGKDNETRYLTASSFQLNPKANPDVCVPTRRWKSVHNWSQSSLAVLARLGQITYRQTSTYNIQYAFYNCNMGP